MGRAAAAESAELTEACVTTLKAALIIASAQITALSPGLSRQRIQLMERVAQGVERARDALAVLWPDEAEDEDAEGGLDDEDDD